MTRARPEDGIHRAILAYLRLRFPRGLVMHVGNELDMAGPAAARQIAKARSLGMVKGFPDLVLMTGDGSGLPGSADVACFEVKAPKGRLSADQAAVLERLRLIGVRCAMSRSVAEVEAALEAWGYDSPDAWRSIGEVTAKVQKTLAKQRAADTKESGAGGATNAIRPLTEANLGKRSDYGC